MKAKLSLLAAACLFALAPALTAADGKDKSADKKDAAKCEHCKDACKCETGKCQCNCQEPEKKTVMLTGSHIPQQVTEVGRITDSAMPVTVITQDDLSRTGEVNLAAALRKSVPAIH